MYKGGFIIYTGALKFEYSHDGKNTGDLLNF